MQAVSGKLKEVGWFYKNSDSETKEIGLKYPNELGFYDLSGNVWECCEDHWHDNYNSAPADGSAWIEDKKSFNRVRRGGGWGGDPRNCRVAYRYHNGPTTRSRNIGFRLALSLQSSG